MKTSLYTLMLVLSSYSLLAQKSINAKYEARYKLMFKPLKNSDATEPETFILLMNEQESFLKNMSHYVMDSLEASGKLKRTGNMNIDLANFEKYQPEFGYLIFTKNKEVIFQDNEGKYSEKLNFNWIISRETKNFDGVSCVKATMQQWGRSWVAYFSPKHPLPFGPYKFNGLPGLIFNIHDEKNEFDFTLYKYTKRNRPNFKIEFNSNSITKKEFLSIEAKKNDINIALDLSKMDTKTQNTMKKNWEKNVRNRNHLEQ